MDYVPLIMAATIIAKEPEKYGFTAIEFEDPIVWDEMGIDKCLDLSEVADVVGCSVAELKDLNPELLRRYTPPNAKSYTLKVPLGTKPTLLAAYDGLDSPQETSWVRHRIRRGETVSTIAAKYGVLQYSILAANNLSRRSTIYAGRTIIVPVPLDGAPSSQSNRSYAAKNGVYVVRSGDTMWDISRAFGTSVDALRRINYIERGSRIYVGQKLKIPSSAKYFRTKNTGSPAHASKPSGSGKSETYKVRAGDTLWDIARRFGTTTSRLRAVNGLGRSSRIYPGQELLVEGNGNSSPGYIIHRVRRGESLSLIARKYRTSVNSIINANNISNPNQLHVGDRLKIYTN
jgi:membrane-bound lytic murein transglycosylase D